ncbi:MAG: hypothetical protein WDW38_002684 [Sanguina aurantia]
MEQQLELELELEQALEGHTDRVWGVAWSPSGEHLASCSGDKTVRIWSRRDLSQQQQQQQQQQHQAQQHASPPSSWICSAVLEDAHTRTIRACGWSPNGRHLATASFDATTAVWELQGGTWEQVATLEGHENEVKCVAWSPDGGLIATCGRDRSVWVWESLPGNEYECVDVKQGHAQDVKMVAWHPSGELLASASYDDSIKMWATDGDEWSCVQTLGGSSGQGHTSTVWAVAFDPTGNTLASCSDDCTVRIWQRSSSGSSSSSSREDLGSPGAYGDGGRDRSWKCTATICEVHTRTIFTLDWSPDGLLATGDGENSIRVFRCGASPAQHPPTATNATPQRGDDSDGECAPASAASPASVTASTDPGLASASTRPADDLHGTGASGRSSAPDTIMQDTQPQQGHDVEVGGQEAIGDEGWRMVACRLQASSQDVNCVRWQPQRAVHLSVQQGLLTGQGAGSLLASAGDDGLVRLWRVVPAPRSDVHI